MTAKKHLVQKKPIIIISVLCVISLVLGYLSGLKEEDSIPNGDAETDSKKEPEFLLKWRLSAFEKWQSMTEPSLSSVQYDPIDYQTHFLCSTGEYLLVVGLTQGVPTTLGSLRH